MNTDKSIIKRFFSLSLLSGILMGAVFPVFSLLFVAQFKSNTMFMVFAVSCVAAGIFVGLASFLIGKITIIDFIKKISNELCDITDNKNLKKRIDTFSKDELNKLTVSVNSFVDDLESTVKQIDINATSVAVSANDLLSLSSQIAINSKEIIPQTVSVESATKQATATISSISKTAEEMSATANDVATAIEEMSQSLKEVSQNCQTELQIAAEANTYAKNSKDVMAKLGVTAESIGKVIAMINDIADQTNLLALNASIEAVSAGDAGKGFAVVASEVKVLAKQTAHATKEIQKQIEDMQANTGSAIKAIESVSKVIEEVNVLSQTIVSAVEEQSSTINEISRNVCVVNTGAKEVSKNVADSASGLSEISTRISDVNFAVSDTTKGIMKVKTSAEELSRLSAGLKALLEQFQ